MFEVYKNEQSESRNELHSKEVYCTLDLLQKDQEYFKNQIFKVGSRYVQIKYQTYLRYNESFIILEFTDSSLNILYDQQKAQNNLLSMINACVSHELRNPLNSISAINIQNAHLYNKIIAITES